MMEGELELDFAKWPWERPVYTEDRMRIRNILDGAPTYSLRLGHSLMRPIRKKMGPFSAAAVER